ncbi:stage II sporulation protein M [Halostagnicola sp. A-GB9-2]|uniref:stage II sporulation protein M n=1 Tax=Halostagnicola sp. A-GB9-2 TaxID=3048066 RepID=UPI0024C02E3F|nr:stage II sporulation protein M [Halostagnicola sp. A-GB9-2]MDJ1434650.1 stage II sporulation protein M [Halostagnicola sp. A-GB9-2]
MKLSTAVSAVGRSLRKPGDLLPFYILGGAIPAIARVFPFLGILAVWILLWATGTIAAIRTEIENIEGTAPNPEQNPEAFAEWMNEVWIAIESGFTPLVGVVSGLTLLVTVLLMIVFSIGLYAVASAGQLATCYARLRTERGMVAGIAGTRRFWLSMLGLYVLEVVLWILVTLFLAGGAGLVAMMSIVVLDSALLAIPVALIGALVWFGAIIAIRAVFTFAPVAVVVDDTTAFGSLSNAAGFIRSAPVEAIFYFIIALIASIGFVSVISVLSVVGSGSVVTLVTLLLVTPALDLLKTALYGGYRGQIASPAPIESSFRSQFTGGIRRGLASLSGFVRATPGTHAFILILGVGTFVAGWMAAAPFEGILDAAISERIEGIMPPTAALEFFGNNWMVALTTAFSGLAFAIPAIFGIAFNGVFLGATARLEVEPLELLAFVIPHGIFEIPAIIFAGALGVHLGVVFWKASTGSITREAFADELERAFWVLIGIGVLLAIAGFVEGFISPFYYRPFF